MKETAAAPQLPPADELRSLADPRLFTGRFFLVALFSFLTFFMGFQLFPTMPLRILALGGSKAEAGLFLGFMTFSSALSAPFGGAVADRLGQRRILLACSAAFLSFSLVFAAARSLWVLLPLAVLFGIFWSAVLAASFAMMTGIIPAARRAEGIGYAGMAGTLAIALAPIAGFASYRLGWLWLCASVGLISVVLLAIGSVVRDQQAPHPDGATLRGLFSKNFFERRVFQLSITLLLYSFGYGGVTSFVALYARDAGTEPQGIYFLVFAATMTLSRPLAGRVSDRMGRKRVLLPCLVLIVTGQFLLTLSADFWMLGVSAFFYGIGFGAAFPTFAAMILDRIDAHRRGAAFGSMLMAFDIGIGSGSILNGVLIEYLGYQAAFGASGLLALLSIPYFLAVQGKVRE